MRNPYISRPQSVGSGAITATMFGAVGDGTTDDTTAVHKFFDYLATYGGQGVLGRGIYLIDPYKWDFDVSGGLPFTLKGEGRTQSIIKMRTAGNALSWWNGSGVHIHDIGLDCRYSVLGNAGHGFVIYNCNESSVNDCDALDFKGSGFLGYTDTITSAVIYERVFFRRCYASAQAAKTAAIDCNGVLLSDYWRSGIVECTAEHITSFGIELKQNACYNIVRDCKAKNCAEGFGMGQTSGDGCDFNIISGFIAEECLNGGVIGYATHNLFSDFFVDMTAVSSGNQIDAFRFSTGSSDNMFVGLKTRGLLKPGLRFITGASRNYVTGIQYLENGIGFSAYAFDSGADYNYVRIGYVEDEPTTLTTGTDSGAGNSTFYERSQSRTGLSYVTSSGAAVTAPANDTDENTLATVTIPANAMGPNGYIRIIHLWTLTNSANAKTKRIKLGGSNFLARAETTVASSEVMTIIRNRNSTSSQVSFANNATSFSTSANTNQTGSIDTTSAQTLLITGQKATGTETMTLESYIVEVYYVP